MAKPIVAKPIVAIAKKAGIETHMSPYFMRRTFQGLFGAAPVHDFVARAISGHVQQLYSTVDGAEVRRGLAKIISLAGFRQSRQLPAGGDPDEAGGDRGGDRREEGRRCKPRKQWFVAHPSTKQITTPVC